MYKVIIFDLSRVIIFPKDKFYLGKLNDLYDKVSELPRFNFDDYYFFNDELLEYLAKLKNKITLNIFTTGHIQDNKNVINKLSIFNNVISVEKIPYGKMDPKSYSFVIKNLNVLPEQTIYVDDTENNIDVAKKVGITTILYHNNRKLFKSLGTLLN